MKIVVLMENTAAAPGFCCEHGLSLYIETMGFKILFDAGQSAGFARNAEKLGIDLSKVDFAVLSHGHYDHGGGLGEFVKINSHAPIYVSRSVFEPHHNGAGKDIGIDISNFDLTRVRFVDDHLQLGEGIGLHSCNDCEPLTPAEAYGQTVTVDGEQFPDAYRHEQYLLIEENGKRVCFSGCSHKGILNIVHWFRPDVLVGGFHFMKIPATGAGKENLLTSAQALLNGGTVFYTGHCTGFDQYEVLKTVMTYRLHRISSGITILI